MVKKSFIKLVATAAIAVGTSLSAFAADPIKIGSVLSVTGPAAFLGDPELKTLQLYIEKINKEGGVLGRQLQLVHYDDGSDASKANGFAKRLIDDDKVDIIVGGTTTGSTMSMAPLVEKAEMPFISLAGAVVIVEPVKKWIFKTPHTDRMAAEKVFEDMKKRNLTTVALLSETSGFGASGKKETEAMAAKMGIALVANETYGPKDTDMTPQLTKIKNTRPPCSTIMRPAEAIVSGRCAMMMRVSESFLIASLTARSLLMSSALVASSRNRIEGFL